MQPHQHRLRRIRAADDDRHMLEIRHGLAEQDEAAVLVAGQRHRRLAHAQQRAGAVLRIGQHVGSRYPQEFGIAVAIMLPARKGIRRGMPGSGSLPIAASAAGVTIAGTRRASRASSSAARMAGVVWAAGDAVCAASSGAHRWLPSPAPSPVMPFPHRGHPVRRDRQAAPARTRPAGAGRSEAAAPGRRLGRARQAGAAAAESAGTATAAGSYQPEACARSAVSVTFNSPPPVQGTPRTTAAWSRPRQPGSARGPALRQHRTAAAQLD